MTYFLEHLAHHLYSCYKDSLDKQCLVFPSKRAGLYFLKYFSAGAGIPVWAPAVKTVNELFESFSSLEKAEPDTLIFELYRVYKDINPEAESFDDFYFWGEMLINDFDDIDKYLVNPDRIFANLADIRRIDCEFGDLTVEQKEIIRQFWTNFAVDSPTTQKKDFLSIWSLLPDLYNNYRRTLRDKGIAYEGMIFRDLAELSVNGFIIDYKWDVFHFIGFNALNNCEIQLMKELRKTGRAKFYWDYDNSYVYANQSHSAGFFIRQNLKLFGNDMPEDWSYDTLLSSSVDNISRNVIDTSADVAQVKHVAYVLSRMGTLENAEAHHTAIVLSDENLLIPLLSSIPENIQDINVTMGYPLRFSQVYSLVKQLISLQRNSRIENYDLLFDHNDVIKILKNSYLYVKGDYSNTALISELISENNQWISSGRFKDLKPLDRVFVGASDVIAMSDYLIEILEILYIPAENETQSRTNPVSEINIHNEFIYRILLALNRLRSVIEGSGIELSLYIYTRILEKVLKSLTIPFSGEPLKGIQIMGILETRTLDFKNLIMLSVNEGTMPRSSAGSSYIPFNLREAFGLPTLRHQDSIFAYYFYRLLHRTEKVTLIYNSNSEGLRTGEMSRFLMQMKYMGYKLDFTSPGYRINISRPFKDQGIRSDLDISALENAYLGSGGRRLSPSAVNTWLICRKRFYYRYVCNLKEPVEILTEVDAALFGSMLHAAMEKIYSGLRGSKADRKMIKALADDKDTLNRTVENVFREILHNGNNELLSGNGRIATGIVSEYISMILRYDAGLNSLVITDLEKEVIIQSEIRYNGHPVGIKIGGIIDRLDIADGIPRILDYKTGNTGNEIKSVGSLFDNTDEYRNDAWFQVLMYCEINALLDGSADLQPVIYALRKLHDPGFSGRLIIKSGKDIQHEVKRYSDIRGEYSTYLKSVLESIFNSDEPFLMTEHTRKCDNCPYRRLCDR